MITKCIKNLMILGKLLYQRREPLVTVGEISEDRLAYIDCSSFVWAVYNNAFEDFHDGTTGNGRFYPQTESIMNQLVDPALAAGKVGEDHVVV